LIYTRAGKFIVSQPDNVHSI